MYTLTAYFDREEMREMVCRFCGKDPEEVIILLPNPVGEVGNIANWDPKDPAKSIYACLSCGEKNGYYCVRHTEAHTAFGSRGQHACKGCIEEAAYELRFEAQAILDSFPDAFAAEDVEDVFEDLRLASDFSETSLARCLARWIVCYSVTSGKTAEEIITEIRQTKEITFLLPHPLGISEPVPG